MKKNAEPVDSTTGLTSTQEKCAILMASGVRLSEVVRQVEVSRNTLYRWQNQAPFQCYYNLMKQDVKNFIEGNMLGLHTQAIETIRASLTSGNEAVRLKAAMWVVDRITQMQIGTGDVREVLKEQSEQPQNDWMNDWKERRYQQALEDYGLDE